MNNIEALKDHIICPKCGDRELSFTERSIDCVACAMSYPIVNGIPEFILPDMQSTVKKTQAAFQFKWALSDNNTVIQDSYYIDAKGSKVIIPVRMVARDDNWIEVTKKDFDLTEDDVRGKTVLDIGAGFGRMAYVMGKMGAKHIYSLDLCRSGMESALKELSDKDNITFIQADIENMPFKPESFDIVVSWGVFHHTPNTERSFRKGAKLVKPGGRLLVHLYEAHNPMRIKYTNQLRAFIQLFPLRVQYWICNKFLVIRDWSVFNRQDWKGNLMRYLHRRIMFGNNPIGTFDCYSPRFNHTHTDEEVLGWYESEGFPGAKVVNKELYDPNFSEEDNAYLRKENGKHGGFLLIKGTKI